MQTNIKQLKQEGWELAGHIGVDAGLCWIGDPCYIAAKDCGHQFESWSKFCDLLDQGITYQNIETPVGKIEKFPCRTFDVTGFKSFNYKLGHEGLGVCVRTGWGDGTYPVYVKKNKEGRVMEARVLFDWSDDEANN